MDLTGSRVRLRELREEDAPLIVEHVRDPEVVRFLESWAWRPYGLEDARDFIRRRDPGALVWGIECLEDGAFIGSTALRELDFRDRNCEWGIYVAPRERWGKGYGTEACRLAVGYAFGQLGMEKVYLSVHEGNDRGRRAYEKAGFKLEGTLPRNHLMEGRLVTTYVMAVYRDDPLYT
jgi:RimJ/RimL family protein N-acetyltransferase